MQPSSRHFSRLATLAGLRGQGATFRSFPITRAASRYDLRGLRWAGLRGFFTAKANADGTSSQSEQELSSKQKRILFIQSAVPMIGFGFMDNVVMITMGDLIDSTLGVTFGLSTLTAAGFGQIFSDVSGVCFGGTVEAIFLRLGLPTANLTSQQAQLKVTRLVSTFGAACGVVVGCLLGMSTLLLHNKEETEERKHEAEFNKMLESENKADLKQYMTKLRKELMMAEKALEQTESAIVHLAPLVQSPEQAHVASTALQKLKSWRSQDRFPGDREDDPVRDAATERALAFLRTRNSIAISELPPFAHTDDLQGKDKDGEPQK
uniref:Transmembrane protein 65 n=1 Tax=Hanusia phi TaxID=3032 RepID=A0A7S0HMU1_9CRYP